MSKFYLFRKQKGYGCDYTIGCGKDFVALRASTKEDALKEVINLPESWEKIDSEDELDDFCCESGLRHTDLESCQLIEVSSIIDILPSLRENKQKLIYIEKL